jgi:hypothetical protein
VEPKGATDKGAPPYTDKTGLLGRINQRIAAERAAFAREWSKKRERLPKGANLAEFVEQENAAKASMEERLATVPSLVAAEAEAKLASFIEQRVTPYDVKLLGEDQKTPGVYRVGDVSVKVDAAKNGQELSAWQLIPGRYRLTVGNKVFSDARTVEAQQRFTKRAREVPEDMKNHPIVQEAEALGLVYNPLSIHVAQQDGARVVGYPRLHHDAEQFYNQGAVLGVTGRIEVQMGSSTMFDLKIALGPDAHIKFYGTSNSALAAFARNRGFDPTMPVDMTEDPYLAALKANALDASGLLDAPPPALLAITAPPAADASGQVSEYEEIDE